jgi:hypothetical protein
MDVGASTHGKGRGAAEATLCFCLWGLSAWCVVACYGLVWCRLDHFDAQGSCARMRAERAGGCGDWMCRGLCGVWRKGEGLCAPPPPPTWSCIPSPLPSVVRNGHVQPAVLCAQRLLEGARRPGVLVRGWRGAAPGRHRVSASACLCLPWARLDAARVRARVHVPTRTNVCVCVAMLVRAFAPGSLVASVHCNDAVELAPQVGALLLAIEHRYLCTPTHPHELPGGAVRACHTRSLFARRGSPVALVCVLGFN